MTYTEVREHNKAAFAAHWRNGRPEADDTLNESNRELIKAYAEEFPEAICLKLGYELKFFRPAEEPLYNFCCNYIFDGASENTEEIKRLAANFWKSRKIDDLNKLIEELEKANVYDLVWS